MYFSLMTLVAGFWTAGGSDNRQILQEGGNNSCIKSISAANVCLAPDDRCDDLPSSVVACEKNNIIVRNLWRCRGFAMEQR